MATAIGWSVVFGGIALVVAGALSFLTAMVAAGSVEGAAEWLVVLGPVQVVAQGTAALGGGFAATYVVGIRRFGFEAGDLRWRCVLPPAKGFAVGLLFGVLPAITGLLVPVLLGSGHWLVGDEGIGAFGAWSGRMALVLAPGDQMPGRAASRAGALSAQNIAPFIRHLTISPYPHIHCGTNMTSERIA